MKEGTTLEQVRRTMLLWNGTPFWAKGAGVRRAVGDMYVKLPVGRVWRYTLELVPPESPDTPSGNDVRYWRLYVLDRGVVQVTGLERPRELFTRFNVFCAALECRADNGALAGIMSSVGITSANEV